MAHNQSLLTKRNEAIKTAYRALKKRNPKWSWEALIQDVADDFYLSPATVGKIIRENDKSLPCIDTIVKYTRPVMAPQLALSL